jgi:hypothetical protein
MANSIVIFTEEGIKRVVAGLAELPAKLSHELLNDIESQLSLVKSDVKRYVAMVEEHLAPHKAAVPAVPVAPVEQERVIA